MRSFYFASIGLCLFDDCNVCQVKQVLPLRSSLKLVCCFLRRRTAILGGPEVPFNPQLFDIETKRCWIISPSTTPKCHLLNRKIVNLFRWIKTLSRPGRRISRRLCGDVMWADWHVLFVRSGAGRRRSHSETESQRRAATALRYVSLLASNLLPNNDNWHRRLVWLRRAKADLRV